MSSISRENYMVSSPARNFGLRPSGSQGNIRVINGAINGRDNSNNKNFRKSVMDNKVDPRRTYLSGMKRSQKSPITGFGNFNSKKNQAQMLIL